MAGDSATISWSVGDSNLSHEVQLRDGKLLLSAYYLQSLLPPSYKLLALCAVINGDNATSQINVPSHWDIDGNELFIIDSSLTTSYKLLHSESCVYVSDSELEITFEDSLKTSVDFDDDRTNKATVLDLDSSSNDIENEKQRHIVPWILETASARRLKKLLALCEGPMQVSELPQVYNGNVCFELPPTYGNLKNMDGMEQRLDGHLWTRPSQTNMAIECTVRLSYCLGYLQCHRLTCPHYLNERRFNDSCFHGYLDRKVSKGYPAIVEKSSINCHYCQKVVTCIATCDSMIYYVFPLDNTMTRLAVHIGEHGHNVQQGTSRASIEKIKKLVRTVLKIDKGGPRKIQMLVARQMLFDSLIKEDDKVTEETELHNFLEEMMPLVQNKGFNNIVSREKTKQGSIVGDGYDNILQLQKKCMFPFFHGSRFPGQGGVADKCYLFKMSTKGPASGIDLVNRMRQTGQGDLRHAWVHFDYTHRIEGWSTMSCSVYDPSLRALQVIAICETKEEDAETQILFWENLNSVVVANGHDQPDFAGFMADEAGANWIAIRTVYNGGPNNVMEGRERSCLFHWQQSLQKYTKRFVNPDKHREHIDLCEVWRLSKTNELASTQASSIKRWWLCNLLAENIKGLKRWFTWWEERIFHWGNIGINDDTTPWERAQIPNTNLSESIHASWLAGEGGRRKISLYDACVTDVLNSYIQCARRLGYMTGRFIGTGPNMESFLARIESHGSPKPAVIARTIQGVVAGTPMYAEPEVHGDKETVQQKRRAMGGNTSSHKPEYVMQPKKQKPHGRPRRIQFIEQERDNTIISSDDTDNGVPMQPFHEDENVTPSVQHAQIVLESVIDNKLWALRRMPTHCSRKCFGKVGRRNCGNVMQSRSPGLVAPCFWSERTFKGKRIAQWMWFCSHDVQHTKMVNKQVIQAPIPPTTWPVVEGTTITREELAALTQAGFSIKTTALVDSTPNMATTNAKESGSSNRSKKWRHGISKDARKRIEAANLLEATFLKEFTFLAGKHAMFQIQSENMYEVHINTEPSCSCLDFQKRESSQKPFLACKHMYYVYLRILGLQPNEHLVMHQPMFSPRDITFMLAQGRKIKPAL